MSSEVIDNEVKTCPKCGSDLFREVSPRDSRVKTFFCIKCSESPKPYLFHVKTVKKSS